MKVSILTSVASLISILLISGCAINRAESLRMLDTRADYDDPKTIQDLKMREAGIEGLRDSPIPVRSRPKVAAIWIHPHEMASHDYFWGGWMSVVVESDQWVLTKPGKLPPAPAVVDASTLVSKKKPKPTMIKTPTLKK